MLTDGKRSGSGARLASWIWRPDVPVCWDTRRCGRLSFHQQLTDNTHAPAPAVCEHQWICRISFRYSLIRDSKLSASGGAAMTARFIWRVGLAREDVASSDVDPVWKEKSFRHVQWEQTFIYVYAGSYLDRIIYNVFTLNYWFHVHRICNFLRQLWKPFNLFCKIFLRLTLSQSFLWTGASLMIIDAIN